MDKLVIRGGSPLLGTVRISGAKNAGALVAPCGCVRLSLSRGCAICQRPINLHIKGWSE